MNLIWFKSIFSYFPIPWLRLQSLSFEWNRVSKWFARRRNVFAHVGTWTRLKANVIIKPWSRLSTVRG